MAAETIFVISLSSGLQHSSHSTPAKIAHYSGTIDQS